MVSDGLRADVTSASGVARIHPSSEAGLRPHEGLEVVPAKHRLRWLCAGVIVLALVWLGIAIADNPKMGWSVVGHYLFEGTVLDGLWMTVELTVLCMIIAIVLGTSLAIMRLSDNPVLVAINIAYVWFFRGVPVLVQIIVWFNLAAVFPVLGIGIPFSNVNASVSTNSVISGLGAALLGLGLYEAGYMAEIVRGGITSIDRGQRLAAQALGLPPKRIMRRIVLPQALRVIVPPTGNEIIAVLKATSLVSVIAVAELLTSVQNIYSRTFQTIPLLIVASVWYLVLTTVLTVVLAFVERAVSRGVTPTSTRGSLRGQVRTALTFRRPGQALGQSLVVKVGDTL